MKSFNTIILAFSILTMSSCGQLKNILDGTEHLPDQIAETNRGMASTNETIRKQKNAVCLDAMLKKENRAYLTPVPGDMMPYGQEMAQSMTVEETLKFAKDYLKKVNGWNFNNQYPNMTETNPDYVKTLEEFEHNKLADLMMVAIVAGFMPDTTVQAIIDQESEQGAYRDFAYQLLMLRVTFNSDLMLNASVMNSKLDTVGKINLAIEYSQKVDFVSKLSFADRIGLKITGFTTAEKNFELKLDTSVAVANWNAIYSAAQSDFVPTSFALDSAHKQQAIQSQNEAQAKSLDVIRGYLKSWGALL